MVSRRYTCTETSLLEEIQVSSSSPGSCAAAVMQRSLLSETRQTPTFFLCSNREGTKFVHIQVKTFVPGTKTCSVGLKAEKNFGPAFFWVLGGIPQPDSNAPFEYFVIPSADMARNVRAFHERWLAAAGKKGQAHKDSSVRAVNVPPTA